MTPSQLSAHLNHIATAIDNSKQPSRELVAAELKKTLAAIEGRRFADWDAVKKAWPDLSKKFVKLQYMIKNKDDSAADLAGAIGGMLQDMGGAIED